MHDHLPLRSSRYTFNRSTKSPHSTAIGVFDPHRYNFTSNPNEIGNKLHIISKTMQTSLPFFVVSLFFLAFSFLLGNALGSILSVIATFHRHQHASSLRFTHQAGIFEMLLSLFKSSRHVPRMASFGILLTIVANVIVILSGVILSRQIEIIQTNIDRDLFMSKTTQVLDADKDSRGWTAFVGGQRDEAKTVEAVFNELLTGVQYIDGFDRQLQYTPKMYTDDAHSSFACRVFGVALAKNFSMITEKDVPGDCAVAYFDLAIGSFEWNVTNATVLITEPFNTNVVMATIYGSFSSLYVEDLSPWIYFVTNSSGCAFFGKASRGSYSPFPPIGMTVPPSTNMYRCKFQTGEMFILAPTYFAFAVHPIDQFSTITATIFGNNNNAQSMPLLATMQEAIISEEFAVHTFNSTLNSTMVVLTDAITMAPLIHYLSCNSRWLAATNDLGVTCVYVVLDAAITTAQPSDPLITAAIGSQPVTTSVTTDNTNHLVIKHLASGSVPSSGLAIFNVANILAMTKNVTRYAAQLGPNFFVDQATDQVYILYETTKKQTISVLADEIFWSMIAIMALSVLIWGLTEWRLGYKYTGSLLKIVHAEMQPALTEPVGTKKKLEESAMLMHVEFQPLRLDGVPILRNRTLREREGTTQTENGDREVNGAAMA